MGLLEDTLKALERLPVWKRLAEMPDNVARLEQRVAELEKVLRSANGDKCPKCGAMAFTLQDSRPAPHPWGEMGVRELRYSCSNCSFEDVRQRNPSD